MRGRGREERGDFHLMVELITRIHTDGKTYIVREREGGLDFPDGEDVEVIV